MIPLHLCLLSLVLLLSATLDTAQSASWLSVRGGSQAIKIPPFVATATVSADRLSHKTNVTNSNSTDAESPSPSPSPTNNTISTFLSNNPNINESQIRRAAARFQKQQQQNNNINNQNKDGTDANVPKTAEFVADTKLPTDVGHFRLRAYRIETDEDEDDTTTTTTTTNIRRTQNEFVMGTEPCVIYAAEKPPFGETGALLEGVPVRVHDQCMTSEVFRSQRCDCKQQLKMALEYIQEHGGFIIYLQQEGRGIGLANKVAAYALQDAGLDTVDANVQLGLPEDCRNYGVVPSILADLKVQSIRLLTNNPRKVDRLGELGVQIDGTLPIVVPEANTYNRRYLETKQRRMRHANFGERFLPSGMVPPQTQQQPQDNLTTNQPEE